MQGRRHNTASLFPCCNCQGLAPATEPNTAATAAAAVVMMYQAMVFLESMCDAGVPPDPQTTDHLVLQVRGGGGGGGKGKGGGGGGEIWERREGGGRGNGRYEEKGGLVSKGTCG